MGRGLGSFGDGMMKCVRKHWRGAQEGWNVEDEVMWRVLNRGTVCIPSAHTVRRWVRAVERVVDDGSSV